MYNTILLFGTKKTLSNILVCYIYTSVAERQENLTKLLPRAHLKPIQNGFTYRSVQPSSRYMKIVENTHK